MSATIVEKHHPADAPPAHRGTRRPVLLTTLSVRICPEAERIAVENALEADVPLIVANIIYPPPGLATMIRLQGDLERIRETAARAAGLGISTEVLACTPLWRPIHALLALARARDVGLLVFGPDRRHARRRRCRRAAKAIREQLDCLVWITGWAAGRGAPSPGDG
jgi:hypothetical protein